MYWIVLQWPQRMSVRVARYRVQPNKVTRRSSQGSSNIAALKKHSLVSHVKTFLLASEHQIFARNSNFELLSYIQDVEVRLWSVCVLKEIWYSVSIPVTSFFFLSVSNISTDWCISKVISWNPEVLKICEWESILSSDVPLRFS